MAQYTRRGWMKPAMVIFGSQLAYAKQDDEKRTKNGANCSESLIRQGAVCGIRNGVGCGARQGNDCFGRIGATCQDRMGPQCNVDRMGQPCAGDDRMGQPCVNSTDDNAN